MASISGGITGYKNYVEVAINVDVAQMAVHLGKAEFAQSGFPRIVRGYDGTFGAYKGKNTNNIRLVLIGPLTKTPWFSMKRYDNITSWDQMKGKKILGGVTGMYMQFAEASLKYHKVYNEIKELKMGVGTADFLNSLVEGRAAAGLGWSGTMMYQMQSAGGYNIIDQPADEVNTIIKQFDQKGWVPTVLRKGEFGAEKDYSTAAIPVALLAGVHVPSEVVYKTLAAIMDSTEKLAKIHEKAGQFDKEDALVGLGCPIHPGAKKYFQEQGMWTSELETENQRLLKMYGFKE
jgi:TRAP-type uncharacterized transport system substrate-binding protein